MRKATEGYEKNTRNTSAYSNPILKEWVESPDMGKFVKGLSFEDVTNNSHKINFDADDVTTLEEAGVGMQTVCKYITETWNVTVSGHTSIPVSDPNAYAQVTKGRNGNEDTVKEFYGIQLSRPRNRKVADKVESPKPVTKAKAKTNNRKAKATK